MIILRQRFAAALAERVARLLDPLGDALAGGDGGPIVLEPTARRRGSPDGPAAHRGVWRDVSLFQFDHPRPAVVALVRAPRLGLDVLTPTQVVGHPGRRLALGGAVGFAGGHRQDQAVAVLALRVAHAAGHGGLAVAHLVQPRFGVGAAALGLVRTTLPVGVHLGVAGLEPAAAV